MVVEAGLAAGRQVLLAQPQRAKAFLASEYDGLKTDGIDRRGLALYGIARRLPPFPRQSATVDQLDQLQAARKGLSLAISRLQQQAQELPYAAASLQAAQRDLEARRTALDAEIAAVLEASELAPLVARLQEVPGIGPVTATAAAACLTQKQFTHPDQFVHYMGFSVTHHASGQQAGKSHLRGHGHAELRRLFYLAAKSNLCSATSPFKGQYERERAKGLSSTGALCAVGRKLARLCWSLWKHDTKYDPARIYEQPAEHGGRPAPGSGATPPVGPVGGAAPPEAGVASGAGTPGHGG